MQRGFLNRRARSGALPAEQTPRTTSAATTSAASPPAQPQQSPAEPSATPTAATTPTAEGTAAPAAAPTAPTAGPAHSTQPPLQPPAEPSVVPTAGPTAATPHTTTTATAGADAIPIHPWLTPEYMSDLLKLIITGSLEDIYRGPVTNALDESQSTTEQQEADLAALPVYVGTKQDGTVQLRLDLARLRELCLAQAALPPEERAQLRKSIAWLRQAGLTHAALPLLCKEATFVLAEQGPDHPDTLGVMYDIVGMCYRMGEIQPALYEWVIPRAARQWGVGHADTRSLIVQVANCLILTDTPAMYTDSAEVATAAAQQLPGGLGWGSTVVAPVQDAEAYNSHALLQREAEGLIKPAGKDLPRAKEMLENCAAYFGSLGPHWLATPRKARCKAWLAQCASFMDGYAAAESLFVEAKQAAHRELGPKHWVTLECVWGYAECLLQQGGRTEAALSLFQRTLRIRKEVLGHNHHNVYSSQISSCEALAQAGKYNEARSLLTDTFQKCVREQGPNARTTRLAMRHWFDLVHRVLGQVEVAERSKQICATYGCDMSFLNPGAAPI